jgi:hypothetical protein
MTKWIHSFAGIIFSIVASTALACTGGTNTGSLAPTATYQTQAVSNGQYYAVNVSCGSVYNFTFCSNGGSASWDTQITINQTNNTTQLAYNDDACGLQSNLTWTATFTGTVHVLISRYNCDHLGTSSATMAYRVTPPVSYSAGCTTAGATISGISSPAFGFSPAPSDGATINPTTGAISNATPGAIYQVACTHSCGSFTLPVEMATEPCFILSGNSSFFSLGGENCIQLTQAINNQTGCSWNEEPVNFGSSFTLSVDYYFGSNINGADGTTFTFQPNPNSPCGQNGAQLGAGGIPNSLIIEFDTYDNDGASNNDLSCDHIAIEIDGDLVTDPAFSPNSPPFCGPVCAKPLGGNIDDGGTYAVEIIWDANTQNLEVYFDGTLRLSCSSDFVNTVFGGQSSVYWGITAATGGLNNQQYFCPSTVVVLPTEMVSFTSQCEGEKEVFTWVTASENRVDHYELEYTLDGMIYFPIAKMQAAGNSTSQNTYTYTFNSPDRIQKYYRIKTVDQDGYMETSDIIASKACYLIEMLNGYTFQENGLTIQSLEEAMEFQLLNSLGQELANLKTDNASTVQFNDLKLCRGVYILKMKEIKTDRTEVYRIYF